MDKATGSGSGRDNSTSDHDCEGRGHPDSGLHTIIKVNWKVPRALKRIVNTQSSMRQTTTNDVAEDAQK